jgi:hypothetical protein
MRFNGQSARIEKQIVVESDRINIAKHYLDGSKEPEATRDGTVVPIIPVCSSGGREAALAFPA